MKKERYKETTLRYIYSCGYAWWIVRRDFEGIRVKHKDHTGSYVEWPVLVPGGLDPAGRPLPARVRFAVYSFNGESSTEHPNATVPADVRKAVEEILL